MMMMMMMMMIMMMMIMMMIMMITIMMIIPKMTTIMTMVLHYRHTDTAPLPASNTPATTLTGSLCHSSWRDVKKDETRIELPAGVRDWQSGGGGEPATVGTPGYTEAGGKSYEETHATCPLLMSLAAMNVEFALGALVVVGIQVCSGRYRSCSNG